MLEVSSNLKSSTSALMQEYHAITHNIANANTAGFKRRASSFSNKLAEQTAILGSGSDSGGVIQFKSVIDFSQGNLDHTERPLDLAIKGEAFFVIESPDKTEYTRNGQFGRNSNGQIIDYQGRLIAGKNGPITIPAEISDSQLVIAGDGSVMAAGANIGKIRMVEFGADMAKLKPAGDNCFVAPNDVMPVAAVKSSVEQGYRESSNVDSVRETINLITVSRMYEASMKVMTKQSDSTKVILNVAMG
ncbi:MAG: flagellar hook basal-body protein [Planctomycetes bacterium]|nr:flagellar hook basal-body protein [Planctomycetota bacterium]